jgi:translation initiation factor 1 (eIF-1/SUI1)
MPTKDILLNPEIPAYFGNTQGISMDTLISKSEGFSIAILVGMMILMVLGSAFLYLYNSGNIQDTTTKNDLIKRVGTGFIILIVITSFISLSKVMNFSLNLSPNKLSTDTKGSPLTETVIQREPDAGNGSNGNANESQMLDMMKATESEKRSVLSAQKIQVNTSACTQIGQKGCTSVGGMSETSLAMLALLKRNCACDMTVTGGTEWWLHSATTNHRPGNRSAVDLRRDTAITSFIYGGTSNGFKTGTAWNICNAVFVWNGFRFCDEQSINGSTPHWHIQPI